MCKVVVIFLCFIKHSQFPYLPISDNVIRQRYKMKKIDISFAGCGFLALYHAGVLKYIQSNLHKTVRIEKSLGASAGAVVACLALIQYPADEIRQKFKKIIEKARKHRFGAFHPNFHVESIIKEELSPELPRDIAEIVTDRLFISLTNSRGHNLLVSQFNSRTG
ncbi:patanin-like phospholipase domain-containing protein isoform X3 [Eurytemora carolleeae]|uniref:patanin-like phospholipase domain-containing protein isoform X3 n=1 Tax=Eurytemora carolleeae TaxID=1294199 RepID=UPI000C76795E|nr:patanin-like phospholipase domain-containing protein isoform X3 [Eurytemora carolleeae]|eukprot:XP_023339832.1 patanin-like phospholipase domain-containing protein isoform X3 [Eurytemora affinis]